MSRAIVGVITAAQESRFHSRIRKSDGCWLWTGGVNAHGYGVFAIGDWRQNRVCLAHRIAFALHHKSGPNRLVCHTCDNPACCNPDHLFLGTQTDNMSDCKSKGRNWSPRGVSMPHKLNPQKVITIRARAAAGEKLSTLARDFKTSFQSIWKVVKRLSWPNVP